MKYAKIERLKTKRLTLRKFNEADTESAYKNWCSDVDVVRFLTWRAHKSVSQTQKIIDDWMREYQTGKFYHWAIVLNEINQPIGTITLKDVSETNESCIVGYCIGKAWWGKGLVAEALTAVIDFAFNKLELKRVIGRHDVDNPNSGRVLEKCGFAYVNTVSGAEGNNENPASTLKIYVKE